MRCAFSNHDEALVRRLGDLLYVSGIENSVRRDGTTFELWVHDDAQLNCAGDMIERYRNVPMQLDLKVKLLAAEKMRREEAKRETQARAQFIDVRRRWQSGQARLGKVTAVLIAISAIVALVTRLGADRILVRHLMISEYRILDGTPWGLWWDAALPEVASGQWWRLVTPIFVHFGIFHVVFNMLWLKDLGSMIEARQGSWVLLFQVLVIGVASNFGQYWWSGPSFGGMSGVVYGLLGYVWIRSKMDPGSGLFLQRGIVLWMLVWFALCLTGLVGPVANVAHGAGLLVGMLWGFLAAFFSRRRYFKRT